jgi:hypothetical protein
MHILDERRKNCKSHELVVEAYKDQDKQEVLPFNFSPMQVKGFIRRELPIYAWEEDKV